MSALDDIAAKRRRQIEAEGWAPEHDELRSTANTRRPASEHQSPETRKGAGPTTGPAPLPHSAGDQLRGGSRRR